MLEVKKFSAAWCGPCRALAPIMNEIKGQYDNVKFTDYDVDVVSPSHIKKIATGKGNADKNQMYQAFVKETGILLKDIISPNKKEIGNPVSDLVDSYYICKNLFNSIKS